MRHSWDDRGFLQVELAEAPPVLQSLLASDAAHPEVARCIVDELLQAQAGIGRTDDLGGENYRLSVRGDVVLVESAYESFPDEVLPLDLLAATIQYSADWMEAHAAERPPAAPADGASTRAGRTRRPSHGWRRR